MDAKNKNILKPNTISRDVQTAEVVDKITPRLRFNFDIPSKRFLREAREDKDINCVNNCKKIHNLSNKKEAKYNRPTSSYIPEIYHQEKLSKLIKQCHFEDMKFGSGIFSNSTIRQKIPLKNINLQYEEIKFNERPITSKENLHILNKRISSNAINQYIFDLLNPSITIMQTRNKKYINNLTTLNSNSRNLELRSKSNVFMQSIIIKQENDQRLLTCKPMLLHKHIAKAKCTSRNSSNTFKLNKKYTIRIELSKDTYLNSSPKDPFPEQEPFDENKIIFSRQKSINEKSIFSKLNNNLLNHFQEIKSITSKKSTLQKRLTKKDIFICPKEGHRNKGFKSSRQERKSTNIFANSKKINFVNKKYNRSNILN